MFGVKLCTFKGRGLSEIDENSVLRRLLGSTAEERPGKKETASYGGLIIYTPHNGYFLLWRKSATRT